MNLFQRPSRSENLGSPVSNPRETKGDTPAAVVEPDQWIRGDCKHLTPAPVCSVVTEQIIAYLCPDCGSQLPADG